jgi:hypothetical protein
MINVTIASAKTGSPLYKRALVQDPTENLSRAHVATLKWHVLSRKFGMPASELVRLQEKIVELLELLKAEFPEKNGVQNAWKFEKAHSVLHKVWELILFGWLRISAPKDLNTVILILSRRLHTAHFQ